MQIEFLETGEHFEAEEQQYKPDGNMKYTLEEYEEIADDDIDTFDHIDALSIYNYIGNREKAIDVILRIAKQRLWTVASPTQVRPMELFTHPSAFEYLKDKTVLEKIVSVFRD